jgi:L-2-hydroxyglutarate oxidase LhgO
MIDNFNLKRVDIPDTNEKWAKYLAEQIGPLTNILDRSVMETDSLNFGDLADKMARHVISNFVEMIAQLDKKTFNKMVPHFNYALGATFGEFITIEDFRKMAESAKSERATS